MSLADTLKSVEENVGKVWDKIEEVGGIAPENKNIVNMPDSIGKVADEGYDFKIVSINNSTILKLKSRDGATDSKVAAYQLCQYAANASNSANSTSFSVPLVDYTNSGWSIYYGTFKKDQVEEVYLDFMGEYMPGDPFNSASDDSTRRFSALKKMTIKGLSSTPNSFATNSFSGDGDSLVFDDSLTSIANSFLAQSYYNGEFRIPSSVTAIYGSFMQKQRNFIGPLYIPDGVPVPQNDNIYPSLTGYDATSPSYTHGIVLTGPGAAAWKAALPDSASLYRKLILDPAWA